MTAMAKTERHALCDVAMQLGEHQPTLCGEWTVKDLVVHLLVRERSPAALGIALGPLSRLTEMESRRVGARPFDQLVGRLRQGPPRWSPYAVPKLDSILNTLEYFVHHEDIRRAQPGWEPRTLPVRQEQQLWSMIGTAGKGLTRGASVGVVIDDLTSGSTAVLKGGEDPVTVRGLPSELTMFVFGRQGESRVELLGTAPAVAAIRGADFGV